MFESQRGKYAKQEGYVSVFDINDVELLYSLRHALSVPIAGNL